MEYDLVHKTAKKLQPGKFYPLGATVCDAGVNFALYSKHAQEVYLLLFDDPAGLPTDIIRMLHRTRYIWHCLVENLRPGQLYAYKVRGEQIPAWGFRFNEKKLLLDPYARAFAGSFDNSDNLLLAYDPGSPDRDLSLDLRDNTGCVPRCIVIDDEFDWQGDAFPDIPSSSLVIYEAHVKGFTAHPSAQVKHPGTYLGLIEKIPYLRELGVNAVELLPIHAHYTEDFLLDRGLTNYWGYNTFGFFAPEAAYATGSYPGCAVHEFKTMVRELHRAGIEVLLDVVYNHTAEGNEMGPTFTLKGIDNPSYYMLAGEGHLPFRYYMNYTGCGNSLNLASAPALRLVMDSLRYWVQTMHVDGFRFDLASVLGRETGSFVSHAAFFDAVGQDPVLSRVKLIAEPWDLGCTQVGNFPVDWSEWNGRFRDTARRFCKGDPGQLREMGYRLTGSADLYADDGRAAYNSINFITCHDGFTLADLVSYNWKHNEANLENNNDGTGDNFSWNCGAEGTTDDAGILALRRRMAKNHLCLLFLSSGIPMLLGGDEFLRTQRGNNNAYCQDNEISWFDWNLLESNRDICDFTRKLMAFRRAYTILQRQKFLTGADTDADGMPDITWFGTDLGRPRWEDQEARLIAFMLDGSEEPSPFGDYRLFMIFNADHNLQYVRIPAPGEGKQWLRVIDTSLPAGEDFLERGDEKPIETQDHYLANPRSTVVLLVRGES